MSGRIPLIVIACLLYSEVGAGERPRLSLRQQAELRTERDLRGRIVGGKDARLPDNPWQVALVSSAQRNNLLAQFCGGSIISQDWVLTAGHCVEPNLPATVLQVLSGTDDLGRGGVRSRVKEVIRHASYLESGDGISVDYDIALLRIDPAGPPMIGKKILPPAPNLIEAPPATDFLVTGWGVTRERYTPTRNLQQVTVPLVSSDLCNQKRSYDGRITPRMFCAGYREGERDACEGDSGGPASVPDGALRRQFGIVSWARDCGQPFRYGVYTRVAFFRDWVKEKTNNAVGW